MSHNTLFERFAVANSRLPLVAILRGITPRDAEVIAAALYEAGFRLIEVPLNSPDPFASISSIRRLLPADALVGAGSVLSVEQVKTLKDCGGELVVMPNSDVAVIGAAKKVGLICAPGIATPTEAFNALAAGADALKVFPAELVPPTVIKAYRAVLPRETLLLPVGGITPDNMGPYRQAGATGFGLGSALYQPGMSVDRVTQTAKAFAASWASG